MKLKFDANQPFQLDALQAIVDIFEGQPLAQGDFEVSLANETGAGLFAGAVQRELGVGNQLHLSDDALWQNVQKIQDEQEIETPPAFQGRHFSVEMETGTGKTYVYLRSMFELNQHYGFKKFVIVVPSVAIREGTLKSIEVMRDHFRQLYNRVPFDYMVYDSKKPFGLRQFATSNHIQVLIINIDAFNKDFANSEDAAKSNVIFRDNDRLSGRKPIEFIQATNPIVIIDEPQSVDTTVKAKQAIEKLNPLCTLRFSATHRDPYNLLYKLDAIRAAQLNLVKKISVAELKDHSNFNAGYVELRGVNYKRKTANLTIHANATPGGVKEKKVTVRQGSDLFQLSGERAYYRDNYIVSEIDGTPGEENITFSDGRVLYLGETWGGLTEEVRRSQIEYTVKKHFAKARMAAKHGVKVLSLFFIDKVAHYRTYDEAGKPQKGKYAQWFEAAYRKQIESNPQLAQLFPHSAEAVHDGYFSVDNKGQVKDTQGGSADDESTYNKIMRHKERLLSADEPLQFIFSHTALREGWDNPNVFQICTLSDSKSVMKKRQEIGRGLRIPVNQDGERVSDKSLNRLLVVANESYADFAAKLQSEYETDAGLRFGQVPDHGFSRLLFPDEASADGEVKRVGRTASQRLFDILQFNGYLDAKGQPTAKFQPEQPDFSLELTDEFQPIEAQIIDTIQKYRFDRHVEQERKQQTLKLNKAVYLDEEFKALWEKIKHKTTYNVSYATDELIEECLEAFAAVRPIEAIQIGLTVGNLNVTSGGVTGVEVASGRQQVDMQYPLPDLLAYMQRRTLLTRHTLKELFVRSGRLDEFKRNPQLFMDEFSTAINRVKQRKILSDIKYEKLAGQYYQMELFERDDIIRHLDKLVAAEKHVYDFVEYDSSVERRFAEDLDNYEEVRLFCKLPDWFKIDTPIGTYNPDWAVVKQDDETLYLVAETKSTTDLFKLRDQEMYKIHCGERHFEELGVAYQHVTGVRGLKA